MLSEQDVLYLETHFPHARLLNHWNFGGLLIFAIEAPYLFSWMAEHPPPIPTRCSVTISSWAKRRLMRPPGTLCSKIPDRYGAMDKAHEELRRFLVGKRGWKEAYTGMYASIYVKP